jgi:NADH-quinone oxidoreductase subunit G
LYCPVGAITEQSVAREVREKLKTVEKSIAQVDPSLFVNFGEEFGLVPGTVTTGKIISALKKLGFSKVYNTAVGFDAFGLEEAAVVLERFNAGIKEPVYSSYCGSWKNFCTKSRPDLIPGITKTPAPAAITASLTADPTAYSVVVTSCIGKKNGIPKSDVTITARELAQILRLEDINILTLPDAPFDVPFDKGYANAGAGGIADLVLRTVYQKATGKMAKSLTFAPVNGLAGVSAASLDISGKTIAAAVVEGIVNVPKFIEAVAAGSLPTVAYVEVQACPGGCTVGGGSPKFDAEGVMAARLAAAKTLPTSPPIATKTLGGIGKAALEAAGLHKAHAFLHGAFAGK